MKGYIWLVSNYLIITFLEKKASYESVFPAPNL